ncbi:LapA family protein [Fibrivirga algicola]|uniref:LapA family protein n=1 Tax=Fibrivirga algicola TaxID=2950420 RepID=A0ABX0QL06_9BACT|nr:LapA family protein [Fibrivirga algicola]NID10814.1 LapA family protein [Fibrivirga algicola]
MNPLSPWVAFAEISLLLLAAFLIGYSIAWVRARAALRRVKNSIREAKRDLDDLENRQQPAVQVGK